MMPRLSIVLCFCTVVATPAASLVLFDVDFDAMTVGLPPSAGGPPSEPSIVASGPNTSCTVVASSGGLAQQPVELVDWNTSSEVALYFFCPLMISTGHVRITWRASAHQINGGGEMSFGESEASMVGGVYFGGNGTIVAIHGDGLGNQVQTESAEPYVVDQPIDFSVLVDLEASTFDVLLGGELVLADLPAQAPGSGVWGLRFGTNTEEPYPGSPSNAYAFDDFRVETVDVAPYPPAAYFPLVVGNHWTYENGEVGQPADRWLYVDVTGTQTFGIPGEGDTSYRVEFSEQSFGSPDVAVYRVTYFSVNEHGDLGWTAQEFDGSLEVYDALVVYLHNPIVLGDAVHYVWDEIDYTATVVGTVAPIVLPPPIGGEYESLRVREYMLTGGQPTHEEYFAYLPLTSPYYGGDPLAGIARSDGTHWGGEIREFQSWLVDRSIVGVESPEASGGGASARLSSSPNPFNAGTTIAYDVPAAGAVRLQIFDLRGRLVRTLIQATAPAGRHEVRWDGRDSAGCDLASGVYVLRLEASSSVARGRLVLVR